MKIKLAIVIVFITNSLILIGQERIIIGQERINRQKIYFLEKSDILTKSTGWAYNSTLGEWIDYENVISSNKDYKEKYKSLQGGWFMSRTSQNFLCIQTKTVNFDGTKYYVLIVEKWCGEYEYPAIYEDWYIYKKTIGYVFKENEYLKLQNIEGFLKLKSIYTVSIGSKYNNYTETEFLDFIQTDISKNYKMEDVFPVMKTQEGKIRFTLPDYFITRFSKSNFEKNYFETDLENFSKILIKQE